MHKLLVIEDNTILTLIRNPAVTQVIPCLHNKQKSFEVKKKCGQCQSKIAAAKRQAFAGIKSCLAALPPQKKSELKKLLNAEKVRVSYTNPSGKTVQMTF